MNTLALIIRSAPGCGRSGRDQLDMAIAAASMGLELDVIFLGDALLRVRAQALPEAADLGGQPRAWASLEALGTVRYHALARELGEAGDVEWAVDLNEQSDSELVTIQQRCDRVLVL